MSYIPFPATQKAGAPSASDDVSKGFVVGSLLVDTSVSPRTVYECADNTASAAIWLIQQPLSATLTSMATQGAAAVADRIVYFTAAAVLALATLTASARTALAITAARGDILVASAAATWSALAKGAAAQYLRSDGTDPSWSGLLTTDLVGTVAIANGGTGKTTALAAQAATTRTLRGRIGINRNAASTYALGVSAPAISGNAADTTLAVGNSVKCSTSSSINTNAGIAQVTANHAFIFYQETWEWFIATDSDITSQRIYVGFGQSSLMSNAITSAPTNCAFFGYDSGVSPNWYSANRGSGSAASVDSAVAVLASTTYRIRATMASSGSITWEVATLSAGVWTTVYTGGAITTNIPSTTTGCGYGAEIQNLVAAIRRFYFVNIDIFSNSTG